MHGFLLLVIAIWALVGCAIPHHTSPMNEAEKEKYCTVARFYFMGEMGYPANSETCRAESREKLIASYDEGRLLFRKKERVAQLKKEIEEMKKDRSFLADVGRASALVRGESPTQTQEAELRKVNFEIDAMIKTAPDSREYCEHEMTRKNAAKQMIPSFVLNLSPEVATEMSGCSRIVR